MLKLILLTAILTVAGGLVACNEEPVSAAIAELIASYELNPTESPHQVWRYEIEGRAVYYMPPRCCDIYSELYDDNGVLLCHPDGGITGSGDGRCPYFVQEGKKRILIWTNPVMNELR